MTFGRNESVNGKWRTGDVIRRMQFSHDGYTFTPAPSQPFFDAVILGFALDWNEVLVSRPYAYVAGANTTGPTVLLGAETYHFPEKSLDDKAFQTDYPLWTKVGEGRTV